MWHKQRMIHDTIMAMIKVLISLISYIAQSIDTKEGSTPIAQDQILRWKFLSVYNKNNDK